MRCFSSVRGLLNFKVDSFDFVAQEISMLDKRTLSKAELMTPIIETGDMQEDSNPSWPTSMPESTCKRSKTIIDNGDDTKKTKLLVTSMCKQTAQKFPKEFYFGGSTKRFNNRFSRLNWKIFMGLHFYAKHGRTGLCWWLASRRALEEASKKTQFTWAHNSCGVICQINW